MMYHINKKTWQKIQCWYRSLLENSPQWQSKKLVLKISLVAVGGKVIGTNFGCDDVHKVLPVAGFDPLCQEVWVFGWKLVVATFSFRGADGHCTSVALLFATHA